MTISNFNQLINKNFKIKDLVYLFLFVIVLFGSIYIRDYYNNLKLDKSEVVYAIIDNKSKEYLGNYRLYFTYSVSNKILESDCVAEKNPFYGLQKGDTVLIKYAIEDPSIIEIADYCYMRKHQRKGFCN